MKLLHVLFITMFLQFSHGFVFSQNALDFDGVDDFVQTDFEGVLGAAPRSIEAWIKTTANANPSNGGLQQTIVDWGMFSGSGRRFTFNVLWGNAIRLEVGGNGVSGAIPVNDGLWHHVAATFDPTQPDQIRLYVDGQLDTMGTTTVPVNTMANMDLMIGRRIDGVNFFTGSIDEVRVWDITLSQTQIQENMSKEICDPPVNLVAYYSFNQGVAGGDNTGEGTLFDLSGGGHDGILNAFALSDTTSNWVDGSEVGLGDIVFNESVSACDTYTWAVDGTMYNITGNYQAVLPGTNNCDSIFNLDLTILPNSLSNEDVMSCEPYTWSADGMTYSSTGTYTATLTNAAGCDSMATLNLTIPLIDSSISQNGTTLTANATGATYQWVDCDNNFAMIPNETSANFSPTVTGNYAVEISQDGCTVTSSCALVDIVGTNDPNFEAVTMLFPNPSNGNISVSLNRKYENITINIYDTIGRKLNAKTFLKTDQINFEIEQPQGLYILEVDNEGQLLGTFKIIKE